MGGGRGGLFTQRMMDLWPTRHKTNPRVFLGTWWEIIEEQLDEDQAVAPLPESRML